MTGCLLSTTALVAFIMPVSALAQQTDPGTSTNPNASTSAASGAQYTPPPAGSTGGEAPASPQTSAAEAAPSGTQVEDIVVTATRRSVDLQSVPAVIQAVPATQLKAFKIDGVLQLPNLVPGLIVAPSGGNNLYLRGVGSSSTGYNEAQTAVYIDGLYLPNPAMSLYSFNNIERIEVLKGPQGTLYGRNVTAGLISVTTRDPGESVKVDASAGYANFDTVTGNFYGSVPLGDTLGINTSVFYQKQHKGWSINVFNGEDVQKSEEFGIQTKLLWKPGTGTRITGSFIYDYSNRNYGDARQVYPGTVGTDGTPYYGKFRFASRISPSAPFRAYIGGLKIEQDLGFAKLMSLTGYQHSTQTVTFQGTPLLGQPLPTATATATALPVNATPTIFAQANRTWSQELQLTSAASHDRRFDWVTGAFYFDDITKLQLDSPTTCIGTVCAAGTPTRNFGRPTTKSYSAYGDATYRFFEATKLTVGLRYTDETKRLSGLLSPLQGYPNSVAAIPTPARSPATNPQPSVVALRPGDPYTLVINGVTTLFPGIPTKLHFTKLTYRVVLAQDFGDNIHAYVSHNLGFKSGAYNGNAFNNIPANPELLYATEAGVKAQTDDHRVRFNAAYFHYNYKDVQVRSMAPPAAPGNAFLLNVARENIDGIDADFAVVPARNLTIQGAFEFLDAKYADYPGAACLKPGTRVTTGFLNGVAASVTVGANVSSVCNQKGNTVAYAPPFSASLGVTYKLETASAGDFTFNINDRHNSRYFLSGDNYTRQNRHEIIDASIAWLSPNGHIDAQVFARNLTDRYVYATSIVAANFLVVPGAPRTYGIQLGYHY